MGKRKASAPDDLTIVSIGTSDPKARKRKAEAPLVIIDRWQAVADECPCRVSADGHKSNRARVHITRHTPFTTAQAGESTALDGIVFCVPKADIVPPWRTTDAYRLAELIGACDPIDASIDKRHHIGSDPFIPAFDLPRFDNRDSKEDRLHKVNQWRAPIQT